MSFGRKAIIWFLSSVIVLTLFLLAVDIGFIRVAGQPKAIENILNNSGVYDAVVPGLLEEAKTIDTSNGTIPLTDPIVKSAVTSTLTPQFMRTNVNQAVESIYVWLNGQADKPKFAINLNDVKLSLADKVAAGAKQRAATLPACTTRPTSSSIDAFNATCLPRGVTADQVASQVQTDILGGQGFLDDTSIQASDIKTNSSKQSVFDGQLKNFPPRYRDFKKSPYIIGLLAVIFGILIVLIYTQRLQGIRHLGFVLAGAGLLVVLFSLGLNEVVSNKILTKITLNNTVLQGSLRTVIHDTAHALSGATMFVGIIYLMLGAAAVGSYYFFTKRQQQPAAVNKTNVPAKKTGGKDPKK